MGSVRRKAPRLFAPLVAAVLVGTAGASVASTPASPGASAVAGLGRLPGSGFPANVSHTRHSEHGMLAFQMLIMGTQTTLTATAVNTSGGVIGTLSRTGARSCCASLI